MRKAATVFLQGRIDCRRASVLSRHFVSACSERVCNARLHSLQLFPDSSAKSVTFGWQETNDVSDKLSIAPYPHLHAPPFTSKVARNVSETNEGGGYGQFISPRQIYFPADLTLVTKCRKCVINFADTFLRVPEACLGGLALGGRKQPVFRRDSVSFYRF